MLNKKVSVKIVKVKLHKDTKQFSVWHLLAFILVFAAIGGYLIWHSLAVTVTAGAPSAPTNLSTQTINDNEIDLSWTASTSSYGVSGYNVYRNGSLIATTAGTSYDNVNLPSVSSYYYYVTAQNAYGSSAHSSTMTGKTYSTNPPTVPGNFSAKVTSATTVTLDWNASTPEQVPIQEYDIYEYAMPAGAIGDSYHDGQFIGSAAASATEYQASGLSPSTSYLFYAVAVDTSGNFSNPSDQALATTNATGNSIYVTATASAYNVSNGRAVALIWSSSGSNLTCTKTFDLNSDARDPAWSGIATTNTTGVQWLYPPNSTADYITYYYELSCTNGTSTAMSGIAVTVAPTNNTVLFQTALDNSLSRSGDSTTAPVRHLNGAYQDPLRGVSRTAGVEWSFQPLRTDAGVDYWGIGPVYAMGPGIVESYVKYTAAWQWGGHFISYKLTSGPARGLWIYVAESCKLNPNLHVGSVVDSSTRLCTMYKVSSKAGHQKGGIETGWARPLRNDSEALAWYLGGGSSVCYYYRISPVTGQKFKDIGHSPQGRNFSHLMAAINPEDAASNSYPPKTQCSSPALTGEPVDYNYKWLP